MSGRWQMVVGILSMVAAMSCHSADAAPPPAVEVKPAPVAAAPAAAAPVAAAPVAAAAVPPPGVPSGMTVQVTGAVGGAPFRLVCNGPGSKADAGTGAGITLVTELPHHTIVACRDAKTGYELKLDLVDPKVGRMDASPNQGASVITLHAAAGSPDSTDGGSNAGLMITAWEGPGGHRAGTFDMNWYDNADLKLKEGQFRGSFSM